MPMYIQPVTEQHTAAVASLRYIVESTETVDSYSVDYLTAHPDAHNILIVDRDFLGRERVADVMRVLAELDAIVSRDWEWPLMEAVTPEARLRADTVERARILADAIREAMGTGRPATGRDLPPGEVEVDETAVAPSHTHIEHTGQRARVRQSIVAGQPWAEYLVWVVSIDGDTLTYTTDANPSWFSTATRSEITEWSIVEGEVEA